MTYSIISDIHEDVEALKKTLKTIKNSKLICLGDIVGYSLSNKSNYIKSRNANSCLNLINSHSAMITKGNHDLNSINEKPIYSNFNYPKNWFELSLSEKKLTSKGSLFLYEDDLSYNLNKTSETFIKSLPEFIKDKKMLFSHFLYPNITGSEKINNEIELVKQHFNFMSEMNCNRSFIGHLHVDKLRIISTKDVIELDEGIKFQLSPNEFYIIICPPLVRSINNTTSLTLYNNNLDIISWKKLSF